MTSIRISLAQFTTENSKLVDVQEINSDVIGCLLDMYLVTSSVIYRIKLNDGRVYIGQTIDYTARVIAHKAKFRSNFNSAKVIKYEAIANDEIHYINKYRVRLGTHKVANIDAGSIVKEPTTRRITRWFNYTPTQKAIGAYKFYLSKIAEGNKVSQVAVAEKFGTSKLMMLRVPKLEAVAGSERIDALFNGKKLTIKNKEGKPIATDALLTLIGFYQNIVKEDIGDGTSIADSFSDDELATITRLYNEAKLVCTLPMVDALQKKLWSDTTTLRNGKLPEGVITRLPHEVPLVELIK